MYLQLGGGEAVQLLNKIEGNLVYVANTIPLIYNFGSPKNVRLKVSPTLATTKALPIQDHQIAIERRKITG